MAHPSVPTVCQSTGPNGPLRLATDPDWRGLRHLNLINFPVEDARRSLPQPRQPRRKPRLPCRLRRRQDDREKTDYRSELVAGSIPECPGRVAIPQLCAVSNRIPKVLGNDRQIRPKFFDHLPLGGLKVFFPAGSPDHSCLAKDPIADVIRVLQDAGDSDGAPLADPRASARGNLTCVEISRILPDSQAVQRVCPED